jgi:CCR4-NOT transcriptional regulation complex NOT5 subunit
LKLQTCVRSSHHLRCAVFDYTVTCTFQCNSSQKQHPFKSSSNNSSSIKEIIATQHTKNSITKALPKQSIATVPLVCEGSNHNNTNDKTTTTQAAKTIEAATNAAASKQWNAYVLTCINSLVES